MAMRSEGLIFSCPLCRSRLSQTSPTEFRCPFDKQRFPCINGIWKFLTPEREKYYQDFIEQYETIRKAENRGSLDSNYYKDLPFKDLNGQWRRDWSIRAKSYQALLDKVVDPLSKEKQHSLKIIDQGAGNCWLSYRLSRQAHQVVAIDLLTNDFDGLGVHAQYEIPFIPIQADFDRLPFESGQVDMAIFNASLHYSTNYVKTLEETCRVLSEQGIVVIMDTPVYQQNTSGELMVKEREDHFIKQYGFPSNSIPSENFLTEKRLEELAHQLNVEWKTITPFYGWNWYVRPWLSRLRGKREPARFMLIVGQKRGVNEHRPDAYGFQYSQSKNQKNLQMP